VQQCFVEPALAQDAAGRDQCTSWPMSLLSGGIERA